MKSFKILKEIEVKSCGVLEHVFDLGGYDTSIETLPKIEILKLESLYKLKGICNNEKNDTVRDSLSSFMHVSFPNLKCLSIKNIKWCRKKDIDQENINISFEHAVLFGEEVSFLQNISFKFLLVLFLGSINKIIPYNFKILFKYYIYK